MNMQKLVVGVTHTTGDGDTMAGIASRYGVPLDQLYQAHLNTTRTEAVMPYTVLPAGQRIVVREPRIIAHEIARQGGVGVLVDHCARPNNQRLQHHCLTVLMNMCRTHAIKRDIAYSGVIPTLLGLVTVRPLLGYSTRRSAVTSACDCACVCVCVSRARLGGCFRRCKCCCLTESSCPWIMPRRSATASPVTTPHPLHVVLTTCRRSPKDSTTTPVSGSRVGF